MVYLTGGSFYHKEFDLERCVVAGVCICMGSQQTSATNKEETPLRERLAWRGCGMTDHRRFGDLEACPKESDVTGATGRVVHQ